METFLDGGSEPKLPHGGMMQCGSSLPVGITWHHITLFPLNWITMANVDKGDAHFPSFLPTFFFLCRSILIFKSIVREKKKWHYQNISPSFPFSGKMQKITIPSTHEGFKYSVLVTLPQLPDAKRTIKGGLVLERCMIISCRGVWMCSVLCSCGVVLVTCVYRACMRPLPKHSLNPPCIKSLCCGKLCSCFHHVTNKDGTATDLFLHHLYPS